MVWGELYDFQTFYASSVGQRAKALYYKQPFLGMMAVAPIIFCEAFLPSARRLFWKPQRFPIADAHYAMGFATLYQILGEKKYYQRAVHFLEYLKQLVARAKSTMPGDIRSIGWVSGGLLKRRRLLRPSRMFMRRFRMCMKLTRIRNGGRSCNRWHNTRPKITLTMKHHHERQELRTVLHLTRLVRESSTRVHIGRFVLRKRLRISPRRSIENRPKEICISFWKSQNPDGSWYYADGSGNEVSWTISTPALS